MERVFKSMLERIEKIDGAITSLIPDLLEIYDRKENAMKKLTRNMDNYKKVLKRTDERVLSRIPDTIFCHQLFKKNGKISDYLKHPRLNKLSVSEKAIIDLSVEFPWKFALCTFSRKIHGDFMAMQDLFLDEEFVVYSPSISNIVAENSGQTLFYFLRLFNGDCWETYGLVQYYKGFFPKDFIYFAKLQDSSVETMEYVFENIEKNPLPYLFLFNFAEVPVLVFGENKVLNVFCRSDLKYTEFDVEKFKKDFVIKENQGVYYLKPKKTGHVPQIPEVFYNRKRKELIITAGTERDFEKVSAYFSEDGAPFEPDYSAVLSMVHAASEILQKDKSRTEYHKLFEHEPEPEAKEEMDKMNEFLNEVMKSRNSGALLDIKKVAAKHNINYETACQILATVDKLTKKMGAK